VAAALLAIGACSSDGDASILELVDAAASSHHIKDRTCLAEVLSEIPKADRQQALWLFRGESFFGTELSPRTWTALNKVTTCA
jgi:hypothetical protein